jgi:hypothetical protein
VESDESESPDSEIEELMAKFVSSQLQFANSTSQHVWCIQSTQPLLTERSCNCARLQRLRYGSKPKPTRLGRYVRRVHKRLQELSLQEKLEDAMRTCIELAISLKTALLIQLKRLNENKLRVLGLASRAALVLGISALSLALVIRIIRLTVAAVPVAVAVAAVALKVAAATVIVLALYLLCIQQ